ncbi:MAG: AI-2E family transporter [Vampirovibrio sp.]
MMNTDSRFMFSTGERYLIRLWVAVLFGLNLYLLAYLANLLPLTVSLVIVGTVSAYSLLLPILWLEKGVGVALKQIATWQGNADAPWAASKRWHRLVILSTVYLLGAYGISFLWTHVVPTLQRELLLFLKQLPQILTYLMENIQSTLTHLGTLHPSFIPFIQSLPFIESYDKIQPLTWTIPPKLMETLAGGFQVGVGDSNVFLNMSLTRVLWGVLVVVYIFYALLEGQPQTKNMSHHLPVFWRQPVLHFLQDFHRIMMAFVQGQVFLGLLTGLYMFIIYSLFGVPYALLLSSVFALSELLPVVGTYIGFTPGILVMALTGHFTTLLGVFACSYAWQSLKDNILQPQLFGNTLGMHPIFILLSLLICGKLGGVLGILLAVPVAALTLVTLARLKTFQFEKKDPQDETASTLPAPVL